MIGNKVGKLGEDIAERFMLSKGYSIIEKNYWRPCGEIDIVCQKGDRLHFIEVKSMTEGPNDVTHEKLRPEENVHPVKLKKLARVIQVFLMDYNYKDMDWQFDVVIVCMDKLNKKAKVKMIENQILEEIS